MPPLFLGLRLSLRRLLQYFDTDFVSGRVELRNFPREELDLFVLAGILPGLVRGEGTRRLSRVTHQAPNINAAHTQYRNYRPR